MVEAATGRERAEALDEADDLGRFRSEFEIPRRSDGSEVIYLCGNSLGLQPRRTREYVDAELDAWAELGVEGHFSGEHPWYSYHEPLSAPMARVVGALPEEVVVMNALTVNLHLLMVSFYRPTADRFRILIEAGAFPSDRYAVASQARFHGYAPEDAVLEIAPRDGESLLRTEDIEALLSERGDEIALVLLGGVNYYSGQALDLEAITEAGHRAGCVVGFDLAHAAGNLDMELHDWDVDFAAWCTYKYLNAGPGAVAACFVHDRFAERPDLPRFAGWWGNDPQTRFEMPEDFAPQPGAAGWQLSNAPVLPMAALRASLELFDEAGIGALRERAVRLTEYLLELVDLTVPSDRFEILTPTHPDRRGAQISIRVDHGARALHQALTDAGVVCDYREPDVIRVATAPLYNTFVDVWEFSRVLRDVLADE
jgi:kynureninase